MLNAMSAAAMKRMRARPVRAAPKPVLPPYETEFDRRRIPIEGRRKTREWHEHQARVRAFVEACERSVRRADSYFSDFNSNSPTRATTLPYGYDNGYGYRTVVMVQISSFGGTVTGGW